MDAAGIVVFGSSVVALLASLALPMLGSRRRPPVATVAAAALGLLTAAMLAYVFSADGYLDDGRTVWEVSEWRHRLLLLAVITLGAAATWLATSSRQSRRLVTWVPAVTVVVVLLDYLAVVSTVE